MIYYFFNLLPFKMLPQCKSTGYVTFNIQAINFFCVMFHTDDNKRIKSVRMFKDNWNYEVGYYL